MKCFADGHEMKEENVVLIIAYGNPLRQDDGVGWQTAQHLKELLRDDPVEIIFRQQLTQDLVFSVSNSSRVIFIDSEFGTPPEPLPIGTSDLPVFSVQIVLTT